MSVLFNSDGHLFSRRVDCQKQSDTFNVSFRYQSVRRVMIRNRAIEEENEQRSPVPSTTDQQAGQALEARNAAENPTTPTAAQSGRYGWIYYFR